MDIAGHDGGRSKMTGHLGQDAGATTHIDDYGSRLKMDFHGLDHQLRALVASTAERSAEWEQESDASRVRQISGEIVHHNKTVPKQNRLAVDLGRVGDGTFVFQ